MTDHTITRRKLLRIAGTSVLAAGAGFALAACGSTTAGSASASAAGASATSTPAAAGKLTFQLSYQASPTNNPWQNFALAWQKAIRAASGGAMDVQLFPGGQLSGGNQQKEVDLLQNGTITASIQPSSTLSIIDPRFEVVTLPWILPDYATVQRIISGKLGQEMLSWFPAKGLTAVAMGSNGFRELASRRPVRVPSDLQGLKIRVPGNPVLVAAWKALGADPVVISYSELYTSLQEGTVDGEELPFVYVLADKLYEVCKYATQLNYSYDMLFVTFNKGFWDRLSATQQHILTSTAKAAMATEVKEDSSDLDNSEAALAKHGVTVIKPDATAIKSFQDKVAGIYPQFAGKIGQSIIDQFKAAGTATA